MNILLLHVDGKMPNLALMKIGAWHLQRGDTVSLAFSHRLESNSWNAMQYQPDKVYASCIFTKNREKALQIPSYYDCDVVIGGSGVSLDTELSSDIEHLMPAYNIYDGKICERCRNVLPSCKCKERPLAGNIDFSMGFTSRGCIRQCDFCVVPEKEGRIREHEDIEDFLHPDHGKLILLDNNLLASPRCMEKMRRLRDSGLKVSFSQGLDIRLMDDEIAGLLADIDYYSWRFNRHRLYFAWDTKGGEEKVRRGIEAMYNAGIVKSDMMFYMLVGYNTSFEYDYYRFRKLWEWGVDPFVMMFNYRGKKVWRGDEILPYFARYVNWRAYKSDECQHFHNYERLPDHLKIRAFEVEERYREGKITPTPS